MLNDNSMKLYIEFLVSISLGIGILFTIVAIINFKKRPLYNEYLLVVKNEYKKSLKYKKKLIIALLIPIVAVVSAIGISQVMKPTVNIGILNENLIL